MPKIPWNGTGVSEKCDRDQTLRLMAIYPMTEWRHLGFYGYRVFVETTSGAIHQFWNGAVKKYVGLPRGDYVCIGCDRCSIRQNLSVPEDVCKQCGRPTVSYPRWFCNAELLDQWPLYRVDSPNTRIYVMIHPDGEEDKGRVRRGESALSMFVDSQSAKYYPELSQAEAEARVNAEQRLREAREEEETECTYGPHVLMRAILDCVVSTTYQVEGLEVRIHDEGAVRVTLFHDASGASLVLNVSLRGEVEARKAGGTSLSGIPDVHEVEDLLQHALRKDLRDTQDAGGEAR